MKSFMQKSGTLILTGIIGLFSISASANVTLDNVTDYYLYNTLVQTEFELDNHLVEQIETAPTQIDITDNYSLMAKSDSEEQETLPVSAE